MPWSHDDCCDCGMYSGELYMLRPKLWKSLGLTPDELKAAFANEPAPENTATIRVAEEKTPYGKPDHS